MHVSVDYDLCDSNAICMGILPEVFEVRDDGFLYLLTEEPAEDLRPRLEECVRACPTQAISIS
jgi:ferredoxin